MPPDWRSSLSEMRRMLCPGGLLVVSFPVDPRLEMVYEDVSVTGERDRIEHFGQHDNLRVLEADSARMLAGASCRVEVARGVDCPGEILPVAGPADYDSPDVFFCFRE